MTARAKRAGRPRSDAGDRRRRRRPGGPIAFSLGAAGIEPTIVDPDVIEVSNLHRQIAACAERHGQAKGDAARRCGRGKRRARQGLSSAPGAARTPTTSRATAISSSTAATIRRRSSPSPIMVAAAGRMSSRRRCARRQRVRRRAGRRVLPLLCSRSRSMPPRARRPACSVPWSVRSAVSPARSRSASRAVIARTPARSSYSMICARRRRRASCASRPAPGARAVRARRSRLTANRAGRQMKEL